MMDTQFVNRTIPEPSAGYADDRTQERIKRQAAESRSATELGWTPPTEDPLEELRRRMGWKPRRQRKPRPQR
jgi:hypothetical protein